MLKNQQRTSTSVRTKTSQVKKGAIALSLIALGLFYITQEASVDEVAQIEQLEQVEQVNETASEASIASIQSIESLASTSSNQAEQSTESVLEVESVVENSAVARVESTSKAAKQAAATSSLQTTSTLAAASTASAVKWANVSASVEANAGKLVWSTLVEQNTDHFEIERSLDDLDYENLGSVKGGGKGKLVNQNYEFKDDELAWVQMPRVYYRIKQVGIDGKIHHSDPIEYDFELDFGLYTRIEVAGKDALNIRYAADFSGPVEMRVLTTDGHLVEHRNLEANFDPQVTQLETSDWNRGDYLLQLSNESYALTEPFKLD